MLPYLIIAGIAAVALTSKKNGTKPASGTIPLGPPAPLHSTVKHKPRVPLSHTVHGLGWHGGQRDPNTNFSGRGCPWCGGRH